MTSPVDDVGKTGAEAIHNHSVGGDETQILLDTKELKEPTAMGTNLKIKQTDDRNGATRDDSKNIEKNKQKRSIAELTTDKYTDIKYNYTKSRLFLFLYLI